MEKKEQKFTLGAAIDNLEKLAAIGKELVNPQPSEQKPDPNDVAYTMHQLQMLLNVLEEFDIQAKWEGELWKVVMPESHEPYASQLRQQARNEAIQECIDKVKEKIESVGRAKKRELEGTIPYWAGSLLEDEITLVKKELEKLKTP